MKGPLPLSFVLSAPGVDGLPPTPREVALIGRSNVGKSSLVNALANQKQLARSSKTPGRTQLLNLFRADLPGVPRMGAAPAEPTFTLVDLPGYGYAKISKAIREELPEMIQTYLTGRKNLAMIFVLVDGAIGPTPIDLAVLRWLRARDLPLTVVATKADQVIPSKRSARRREVAHGCGLGEDEVVWVSASKGEGMDSFRERILTQVGI